MAQVSSRSARWVLVAAGVGGALLLGMWGFALASPATSLVEDFYRSLQLFVLELGETSPPLPWQLEVARLAAPAMTVASAAVAVLALSRDRVDAWRASRHGNHVVVAGLGRRGGPAALALHRAGHDVVAVEIDPGSGGVRLARRAGIPVVMGDAGDRLVLERAGTARAAHLVVLTPALELGGRVALAAVELTGERKGPPLTIHVEVDRPELGALLRAVRLTAHHAPSWDLEDLDLAGVGARAMLDAQRPWPEACTSAHVVVVGDTPVAAALPRELRRRWLRTGGPAEHLTVTHVVDPRAPEHPVTGAFPGATSAYVALGDEAAALATALALQQDREYLPVLVRLEHALAFGELVQQDAPALTVVSLDESILTPEVLLASTTERIARALHDSYRRARTAEDPSSVPWEQLPDSLRASNREQARAVAEKLRLTGRVLVPDDGTAPDAFTETEIEQLGELEHVRWVREREAAGWTPGPRDTAAKTTPYLVPWSELDEDARELDRQFVRALPDILADAGLLLRRVTRPGARSTHRVHGG